jgi:hypothetical protein
MRVFSLAALLLFLLPFPALAEDAPPPDLQDKKYYICEDAADCAVAHTPCGGFEAVNKEYLEELQAWFDKQSHAVKCRQPPPNRPQVKLLHCNLGWCELEMTAPAEPDGQKSVP